MTLYFGCKYARIHWQFNERNWGDPEVGRCIFRLRLEWGKHTREWALFVTGSLRWATVKYYYEWNGKRTGWMVQSPVTRIY